MLQSFVSKMNLRVGLIVCCAVIYAGASDRDSVNKNGVDHSTFDTLGYGLELVLTKFDFIANKLQKIEERLQTTENKLDSMEKEIHQQRSTQEQIVALLHERRHEQESKSSQKGKFSTIKKLGNNASLNVSELQNQIRQKVLAALHKLDPDVNNGHNISQQIMKVDYSSVVTPTQASVPQPPATPPTKTTTITTTPKPQQRVDGSSCKNVHSKESGTYLIRVRNDSEPFEVNCEQETFGGGWIVFQFRYDGSLDFYRGWNEFRDGFGDLNKEFWLGLEKVHQITSDRKHELAIEMKDFNGTYKCARYDASEIGSESDQYHVKAIGKYNGTALSEMYNYKGRKFSTKDRDNDKSSRHCAREHEGAWWHRACTNVNLNGRYMNAEDEKSIHWYYFDFNVQGLRYSRMMIRELE
ncbi:ficolin-2-like [Anopheles aquasalis]|uniref:ficolin-2-like n=1 Tax=Anopheles aquasalis TaxID=42839 RepID=UPI00215AA9AE|nr:ficolin-2-like [Anopheles aquasalis]